MSRFISIFFLASVFLFSGCIFASKNLDETASTQDSTANILAPDDSSKTGSELAPLPPDISFGLLNQINVPFAVGESLSNSRMLKKQMENNVALMKDLVANLSRVHPSAYISFAWNVIDPDGDGKNFQYNNTDLLVRIAADNGITLLPALAPFNEFMTDDHYLPDNEAAYIAYVTDVVERYDGDADYGTSLPDRLTKTAIQKMPIKRWQLDNEPDLRFNQRNKNFETPQEYATVALMTRQALQAADKDAIFVFGGLAVSQGQSALSYLDEVVSSAGSFPFDEMAFHWYPSSPKLSELTASMNAIHERIGTDIPLLMTENSVPSEPHQYSFFLDQHASEPLQAAQIVSQCALLLAHNGNTCFWTGLLDNRLEKSAFSHDGLMTNVSDVSHQKKLSWYAYQHLIEVFQDIGKATYTDMKFYEPAYGLMVEGENGKRMIIVMFDHFSSPDYSLDESGTFPAPIDVKFGGIKAKSVRAESSVPFYQKGSEVPDNPDFEISNVSFIPDENGETGLVSVAVGIAPVYVFLD